MNNYVTGTRENDDTDDPRALQIPTIIFPSPRKQSSPEMLVSYAPLYIGQRSQNILRWLMYLTRSACGDGGTINRAVEGPESATRHE